MATLVRMPDLGTTVDRITVVQWLLEPGQTVERGQPLVEVETDKASSELESVASGTLLRTLVEPGEAVEQGDVIAVVGKPGEDVDEILGEASGPKAVTEKAGETASPVAAPLAGRRISPMVRNVARELGVDLESVQGTGPGGTVTRQDVLGARRAGAEEAGAPAGEELSRLQSAVAKTVLRSVREIPHLRVAAAIDMTAVERSRARSAASGTRIGYDAILLKAVAGAIEAVPLVAARLEDGRVISPEGIHVALAVGFENELLLPVIKDVDAKDLLALQGEIDELASLARAGKLKAEQLTGGCMTISNLGMYPVESFDAIIFPEHSAVLAVGAVQRKPVAVADNVEIRPVAIVKLAVDHRLINGRTAAQFLTKLKELLESGDSEED